ncbi:MAG: hypothetical protein V2J02_10615 [Pseudomonadales bacterium]|nr:hypothetical protein [Pseudomonadales bacterium]
MVSLHRKLLPGLLLFPTVLPVAAETVHGEISGEEHGRATHVALLVGGSNVRDEGRSGATIGLDFELELSHRFGVGIVVEHAGDEVDATTALAVIDWHIVPGLVFQVGPGVEYEREVEMEPGHGTVVRTRTLSNLVGRAGFFYEIEVGREWSVAPSVSLDVTEDHETLVWGLAIGRRFR